MCQLGLTTQRGLTCGAAATGGSDAACQAGAARVTETQKQAEQTLPAVARVDMYCYSDFTLHGMQGGTQNEWVSGFKQNMSEAVCT